MDMRVFMPGATEWLCRYCNERFWWHPGNTGRDRPSECACGQTQDPNLYRQLVSIEEHKNHDTG